MMHVIDEKVAESGAYCFSRVMGIMVILLLEELHLLCGDVHWLLTVLNLQKMA